MSADARPRRTRPNGAPAYYLGPPASFRITITTRRPGMTRPLESRPNRGQEHVRARNQVVPR